MDFLRSVTRRFFPQFLTKRGPKRAVPSVLTTKSSSEFVRFRQIKSKRFGQEKTPEMAYFQGFSRLTLSPLTLAEFPYLLQDCQTLPKTPEKTEMVLRFPLGFA